MLGVGAMGTAILKVSHERFSRGTFGIAMPIVPTLRKS